jgi:hypothetical protein
MTVKSELIGILSLILSHDYLDSSPSGNQYFAPVHKLDGGAAARLSVYDLSSRQVVSAWTSAGWPVIGFRANIQSMFGTLVEWPNHVDVVALSIMAI